MPNDCFNRLILRSSDNTKLDEAITAYKKGELLNYFVPQPADIGDGRCGWRNEHWGTTCDIYDQGAYKRTKTAVEFDFSTAWGPPIAAYKAAMGDHGFVVEADYDEPGMGFGGWYYPNRQFELCLGYSGSLEYAYAFDDKDAQEQLMPDRILEALNRIWFGLGEEEIIVSEEFKSARTWPDMLVSENGVWVEAGR
jgi:hypothetical protein